MSETAETTIAKGTYTIENVHRLNDIFLLNGTLVAGTSEADAHPPLDACWTVIPLKNRRYYISPAAQQNQYASWPTDFRLGSEIVVSPTPHSWVVREAREQNTFVISPGRRQGHFYWGIEDFDEGTAVTMRYPPNGPGNQWKFHRLSSMTVKPQTVSESRNIDGNLDSQTVAVPTPSQPREVDDDQSTGSTPLVPQVAVESLANDGSNVDSQTSTTPNRNQTKEVEAMPAAVIPQDVVEPPNVEENLDISVVGSPAIDGSTVDSQTATSPNQSQTNEDVETMSAAVVSQDVVELLNVEENLDNQTATIPTQSEMRDVDDGLPSTLTPIVPQSVVGSIAIDGSKVDSQTATTPIPNLRNEVDDGPARSTCAVPQNLIESPNFDEKVDCPTVTDPTRIQPREAVSGRLPSSTPVSPQSMIGSLSIDGSNVESLNANAPNRSQISEAVDSPPYRPTSVVPQRVIESPNIDESLNLETPTIPTRDLLREEVDGRQATPTPVVPQSVVESRTIADGQTASRPNQNSNDDRPAIRHILEGHTDRVYSVAFSPDGERIVSGSDDLTIRVWEVRAGHLALEPIRGHFYSVLSVAFLPDGKWIVSGSGDRTVRFWDAQTGTLSRTLNGHTDWVRSVACSPDGKQVVSGSDDRTLRVWDVETGSLVLGPLLGHTDWVKSVSFSMDGKQFLSGSRDGTVRVWDPQTGHAIRTLSCRDWVWSASFSPDRKQIVSGHSDGIVTVWDMQSGDSITLRGHKSAVNSVGFSPDGERIVSGGADKQIIVWDANLGTAIGRLSGHTNYVWSVAFSPDGKWIVSGSSDKTVRIWEADRLDASRT